MQFTRLKLSGFKSFVDPTELMIKPGLTGVVGPNGCGKSNLIEALRWVMGETSAKKMRGGAMDDVIFNGTTSRTSRNLAEVTLSLDNAERDAPAAFNETDEIEITRRIEREHGSTYLINGNEVRARDVQLLFADLATGAHSTALVSQGQIGALINAKPLQRRHILEEAAGITGLHSRRHEAELRLRGAETNLERLDDVVQAMEGQLQALKRQARQATRYRNISGHIRKAEAMLLHLRYLEAEAAEAAARRALSEIEAQVAEITRAAAAATTAQNEVAEKLPPLRHAEAERAAALHRLNVAREGLADEEARAREVQAGLESRLAQIAEDRAREESQGRDADQHMERLKGEADDLETAREGEADLAAAAETRLGDAVSALQKGEGELDAAGIRVAEEDARRNALAGEIEAAEGRLERLKERRDQIAAEKNRLEAEAARESAPEIDDGAIDAAADMARRAHETADAAQSARLEAQGKEAESRDAVADKEKELGRIGGEEDALGRLLAVDDDDLWPPLIDALNVENGFEAALGAALGDDLDVPADSGAPVHWRELEAFAKTAALPADCRPLSNFVSGPAALTRRLSQIGVVDDSDAGARLLADLKQGQRLVSKDGGLWRWDGYVAASGAPTPAAQRLAQRNRLEELGRGREALEGLLADIRRSFEADLAASAAAVEAEQSTRQAARQADATVQRLQETHARAVEARASRESRLGALSEQAGETATDIAEAETTMSDASGGLAALPAAEAGRAALAAIREEVTDLRRHHAEANAARERLADEARGRGLRLDAVAAETASWRSRKASAENQIEQLGRRGAEVEAELDEAKAVPEQIAARRSALLNEIDAAEVLRNEAAEALAQTEAALAECERASREANEAQAESRENRVRIEAQVTQAAQSRDDITSRMREVLECAPENVPEIAEIKDGAELPEKGQVEHRLERLKRERDNMGAVNLRAEAEAAELSEQIDTMMTERADLEAAIARLRQGIASLNREGRERLLAAFKEVDSHFRDLFVRLFGGGEAHLALTESDDPLEAGLEIMASPPGKRMQSMSLLSGGEQALTAVSLLFAVFLTNPAPICVLDEVDAPLDDANVERFLSLVEEITASSGTRFLIITHNPLSMAGMERLFGVTMGERGVSQLVSVDLSQAEDLRESAGSPLEASISA